MPMTETTRESDLPLFFDLGAHGIRGNIRPLEKPFIADIIIIEYVQEFVISRKVAFFTANRYNKRCIAPNKETSTG